MAELVVHINECPVFNDRQTDRRRGVRATHRAARRAHADRRRHAPLRRDWLRRAVGLGSADQLPQDRALLPGLELLAFGDPAVPPDGSVRDAGRAQPRAIRGGQCLAPIQGFPWRVAKRSPPRTGRRR